MTFPSEKPNVTTVFNNPQLSEKMSHVADGTIKLLLYGFGNSLYLIVIVVRPGLIIVQSRIIATRPANTDVASEYGTIRIVKSC